MVEARFPAVRREGSALAYVSARNGGQGIFFLDLRTGKERTLVMAKRSSTMQPASC